MAAGAALHYMDITQHMQLSHITTLARIEAERFVRLDKFTVRNLELIEPISDDGRSLLQVIDATISPMGGRLMHRWLLFPLKDEKAINRRLDVVELFMRDRKGRELLKSQLEVVGDMERLTSRVATAKVTPRELVQLKCALQAIIPIKQFCADAPSDVTRSFADQLNPCPILAERILTRPISSVGATSSEKVWMPSWTSFAP